MKLTGTNQSESYSFAIIVQYYERTKLQTFLLRYRYAVFREQGTRAQTRPRARPLKIYKVSGADGGGVTPVPIPNTAVKPTNADGTATAGLLGE